MIEPYMTKAEIEAKYPDGWVFVANPTLTRSHEVRGGYVVLHSADRVEFYRRVGEWDDPAVQHTASWYTGEVGEWLVEILPPDAGPAHVQLYSRHRLDPDRSPRQRAPNDGL